MMTFDNAGNTAIDAIGNQRGKAFDQAISMRAADGSVRTVDSTGAFLIGELERLDPVINMPLAEFTYSRDLPLRSDISVADEFTSFTLTNLAASGTRSGGIGGGKSWAGKNTNQAGGVGVDLQKITNPLTPWEQEVKFTIYELESAARLGRPIDSQKLEALNFKFQLDQDAQAYIGDTDLNQKGLLNHSLITNVSNVVNGASASPKWANKTPAEMLADINELISSVWAQTGWGVMPDTVLIPPAEFGRISTQVISSAGNISILKYLVENNIVAASGGGTINILPCKWTVGAGTGGTIGTSAGYDMMFAYAKNPKYVQFPMMPLQNTPVQYQGTYHNTTYFGKLGVVELRYSETCGARIGVS